MIPSRSVQQAAKELFTHQDLNGNGTPQVADVLLLVVHVIESYLPGRLLHRRVPLRGVGHPPHPRGDIRWRHRWHQILHYSEILQTGRCKGRSDFVNIHSLGK